MKNLDGKDLEDIMVGSAYLGTGGGGKLDVGKKLLADAVARKKKFRLMKVSEMHDEAYAATTYDLGSLSPPTPAEQAKYDALPKIKATTTMAAFCALRDYVGKKFEAVIVGEIGPENTAASLIVAAELGIAALDADTVGRATPEVDQHSVLVSRGTIVPAAGATQFGDVLILETDKKSFREEDIFRAVATVSIDVGVADAAIPGRIAKKPGVLVTGSVSLCQKIGAAYRAAVEARKDPVEAACSAGDGWILFSGKTVDFDSADQGGFTVGQVEIDGDGEYKGQRCKVQFKNENIVARVDDQVVVTVPDLITVVDRATGLPIGNPGFKKGQKVTVVGFRCNPIWRKPAGLKVFEPRHFGFNVDYVPIETLVAEFRK